MSDRLTRVLATVALAIALVALILAGYAVSLQQERTHEIEALSDALRGALEARPIRDVPLRPPPPALDDGED